MTTDKQIPQYFIRDTRDNGEKFYRMVENRPQWLYDAVYECHGSDLPNDWIFEACANAWDAIREGSLTDSDDVHEWSDSMVDVYTRDLYQWAADMCLSSVYGNAEEQAKEMGGEDTDTVDRLRMVQYMAIHDIAATILAAWEENRDQGEQEDSEVAE